MFFFGHLGIGSQIVKPVSRGLPFKLLLLGTILPDLIDKSLYYGLSFLTGKKGADLGLISGTRTLSHTALFLLLVTSIAFFRRSKKWAALALGVGSHLLLDSWSSLMIASKNHDVFQSVILWPFLGSNFPVMPFQNVRDHLASGRNPILFWSEILGAVLLFFQWKQRSALDPQKKP